MIDGVESIQDEKFVVAKSPRQILTSGDCWDFETPNSLIEEGAIVDLEALGKSWQVTIFRLG